MYWFIQHGGRLQEKCTVEKIVLKVLTFIVSDCIWERKLNQLINLAKGGLRPSVLNHRLITRSVRIIHRMRRKIVGLSVEDDACSF